VQVGIVNVTQSSKAQIGIVNAVKTAEIQVGIVNAADSTKFQTGIINVARKAPKIQTGIINIAGKAKGRQIGIINVCGKCEDTPVGIISIMGNGVIAGSASLNETGHLAANVRFGSSYFFTTFEYSRAFEDDKPFREFADVQESGLGIGTQFGKYGTHFDLEYMFLNVYPDKGKELQLGSVNISSDSDANYHHRLRVGSTIKIIPGLGLFGGVSANVVTEGYAEGFAVGPKGDWFAHWNFDGHEVRVWPGLYAGLVVGKF
jgi:hypothetical protein